MLNACVRVFSRITEIRFRPRAMFLYHTSTHKRTSMYLMKRTHSHSHMHECMHTCAHTRARVCTREHARTQTYTSRIPRAARSPRRMYNQISISTPPLLTARGRACAFDVVHVRAIASTYVPVQTGIEERDCYSCRNKFDVSFSP